MLKNTPSEEISDERMLASDPLVSACMITYNQAPYIAQAIESVLAQRAEFLVELVIGEDCSTDRTREIVLDYQRRHPEAIRVITSDSNVGMHRNAYRTLKACRGEYIAMCEGDDYWHDPDKLASQIQLAMSHPSAGLIHSDFNLENTFTGTTVLNSNRRSGVVYGELAVNDCWELLTREHKVCTVTTIFPKGLLSTVLEDDYVDAIARFPMADLFLWFNLARRGKVLYLDRSLATRRRVPGSVTSPAGPMKRTKYIKDSSEAKLYLAEKYQAPLDVLDELRRNYLLCCFHYFFFHQDPRAAQEAFDCWSFLGGKPSINDWVRRECCASSILYHLKLAMEKAYHHWRPRIAIRRPIEHT